MKGRKTTWTIEMDQKILSEYPVRFTRDIAKELNLGYRTIIRRARELGIEKEPDFLDKRRTQITELATKAHPGNPNKGNKSFRIPGGESYRFKKGNLSKMKTDPEVVAKATAARNETIRIERLRIKYGLAPTTKLKLDPYK